MATTTLIPIEQYLDGTFEFEPDAEYVDGEIEERPMGEYDHATWQQAIEMWFHQNARNWNIRVRCELRVWVTSTQSRVPDVVVFGRDNPIEQVLTVPPIAVFEVLSPEDRMVRMLVKLSEYERMGIKTIRVVDPKLKSIYRYEHETLERIEPCVEDLPGVPSGSIDWPAIGLLAD
jgi:Uma2 family endonuclease